jgi:transcriptional regulator with XRE-family HTH domain
MATPDEQLAVRIRRGYWIRRARERKGFTLTYVASMLGYKDKSISTLSRWESGDRQVPGDKFEPLARLLDLPAGFLVSPPLTDDERLDAAVRAASALEREDWEKEQATHRAAGGEPDAEPDTRSA